MKTLLAWCFTNITNKYPGTILALAIVLSGLSVYTATGLAYNSRIDNLLPQDLPLIQEFNEVVAKTGGSGPLVVVLEGLGLSQAPQVIDQLTKTLEKVPGTHYVDSQIPKDFLNNRQLFLISRQELLQLETLIEDAIDYARGKLGGIFVNAEHFNSEKLQSLVDDYKIFDEFQPYHRGRSNTKYYIFVKPKGTVTDTEFTERFVHSIQEAIDRTGLEEKFSGLKINLTGSLVVRLEENQFILRDLKRAAVLAAFLVTSMILIYTRSWFSIPLIIFPLMLSMTYTFALTRLVIGHLNIISGFLVAILMGLGIDYGIHLYIRFKQELLRENSIPRAAEYVATQVGRSGLIAMLTTISVFSILSFSDFRGFSEFGTIATMGIVCAFLTYFFVFPAQALFYDKIHWLGKPKPRLFNLRISNFYSNMPYFLAASFLLLMVGSLFLLPGVEFEYNFQKLRGDSPAGDYETASTDDFGFAFSPTVILTSTKDNLFYIHEALQKIKEQNGDNSTIGIQYSLNLFSRKEYESKKEILDRIRKRFYEDSDIIRFSLGGTRYHQFERLLNSEPFDESAVPGSLVKKLKAKEDYLLLMFSPSDKNFFNLKNVYQLAREIETLKSMLADRNIHTSIMNENLLAAKILDWVKEKGPRAMVIAVILVFLILVIDLQSLTLALKTFLPLFTGMALTGALMALFHVKLNFINIVMLPSIVGIMIGSCVYLSHHILDCTDGDTLRSVQETGSAIILSSLTSLAGYASLNIAHHAGIHSIATMVELGILTCTVCTLFMLPALFEIGAHRNSFVKPGTTPPEYPEGRDHSTHHVS